MANRVDMNNLIHVYLCSSFATNLTAAFRIDSPISMYSNTHSIPGQPYYIYHIPTDCCGIGDGGDG